MAQHYLLSAKARTFSLKQIFRMSEDEARKVFQELRWQDNNGKPVCPHCDNPNKHYWISTRKRWKCAVCRRTFSVTSGTVFAYHKLPLQDYLAAIAIYTNGAKGVPALKMSRDLDVQYKTAFVLVHKIRESLFKQQNKGMLEDEVEIDGAYFGGKPRHENEAKDRKDQRAILRQKKRCVVVMRQRGTQKHQGAIKTKTFMLREETFDIHYLAKKHLKSDTKIFTDEGSAYRNMPFKNVYHVSHGEMYSGGNGLHNNQAESYFARLRRSHFVVHHKMSNLYLSNYASEMAYREDTRRKDNEWIFKDIARISIQSPTSEEWCGYWQGNHRVGEWSDGMQLELGF